MCDRATVLRDGRDVGTVIPREGGERQIVEHMLGPEAATAEARAAEVDDDGPGRSGCSGRRCHHGRGFRSPSRSSRACRSRCVRARFSASPRSRGRDRTISSRSSRASGGQRAGRSNVAGKALRPRHPYDAIRSGLVLVPADRLHALLPQRSVRENIAAPRYNRIGRWGPINHA